MQRRSKIEQLMIDRLIIRWTPNNYIALIIFLCAYFYAAASRHDWCGCVAVRTTVVRTVVGTRQPPVRAYTRPQYAPPAAAGGRAAPPIPPPPRPPPAPAPPARLLLLLLVATTSKRQRKKGPLLEIMSGFILRVVHTYGIFRIFGDALISGIIF